MLEKQNVTIKFAEGVDTREDSKLIDGTIVSLKNAYISKGGGFKKRAGQTSLPSDKIGGGSISSGLKLDTHKDQLCLVDSDRKFYSYSEALSKWKEIGKVSPFLVSVKDFISSSGTLSLKSPDMVKVGNYEIYTYIKTGVRYSVIDTSTKSIVYQDILVTSNNQFNGAPFVRAVGSDVFIFAHSASATITGYKLSADYSSISSSVNITTTASLFVGLESSFYVDSNSSFLCLIYQDSGTSAWVLLKLNTSLATTASLNLSAIVNVVGSSQSTHLYIDTANSRIVYSYHDGSVANYNIKSGVVDTSLAVVTAVSTVVTHATNPILSTVCYAENGVYYVWGQAADSGGYSYWTYYGSSSLAQTFYKSVFIISKAFVYNSIAYMLTKNLYTGDVIAIECVTGNVSAIFSKSYGLPIGRTTYDKLGNVTVDSSSAYYASIKFAYKDFGITGTDVYAIRGNYFDFGYKLQSDYFQNTLCFNGGYVAAFDGNYLTDLGFAHYPTINSFSPVAGSIAIGNYVYMATYSWVDASGQLYESSPSQSFNVAVVGAAKDNYMYVKNIDVTNKTGVKINLYRTENNGTVFYLTKSVSQTSGSFQTEIIDNTTDANLTQNALLYTTGGVIENIYPSSTKTLKAAKNRIFIVPSEDTNNILYSKPLAIGYGIETSDLLSIRTDSSFGDEEVECLGFMDDKVAIFKTNSIFMIAGDGANNAGQQDSFSQPQAITTDVGCSNQRSVIMTPKGIFFKADAGLYLISRDLNVVDIGIRAEAYNAYDITGSELESDLNQVRFSTLSNDMIVYDYNLDQFFTYSNYESVSSTKWKGVFCVLKSNGVVKKENTSVFTDDLDKVEMYIETSWLKLNGIQDFQRIWRLLILGKYVSNHTLTLKAYKDYDSSNFDTYSLSQSNTPPYQYRVHLKNQKCQSIKFSIQENQLATYGEGISLSGLTMEVGLKRGAFKTPSTKQA